MVVIPKKHRVETYSYLFKEGVLICHWNNLLTHPEIPGKVPNLHIQKMMQGFVTKGLVRETFAWRHHYWFLTNAGIIYLREYLHLPSTVQPSTLLQNDKYSKQKKSDDKKGEKKFSRDNRGKTTRGEYKRDDGEKKEEGSEKKQGGRGAGFSKKTETKTSE
jgi:small subunit ribosomal protein S10e